MRIVELQKDLGYKLQHQLYAIETIAGCLAEQMGAENDPARKALLWLCEEGVRMAGELREWQEPSREGRLVASKEIGAEVSTPAPVP